MKKLLLLFSAVLLAGTLAAENRAYRTSGAPDTVTLDNGLVKISFAPELNGSLIKWEYQPQKRSIIRPLNYRVEKVDLLPPRVFASRDGFRCRVWESNRKITDAMQELLTVTENRRRVQMAYNEAHGIVPKTIQKKKQETIENAIYDMAEEAPKGVLKAGEKRAPYNAAVPDRSLDEIISELEREMLQAAEELEFERAAQLRDKIRELEKNGLPSQNAKKERKKC